MSRITPPADRPIPSNEPKLESEQISESESIQKTDTAGEAPFESEQLSKQPSSASDQKGQQYESRLGGLARQAEMQLQFPLPTAEVKDLPNPNPNLDRNIQLNENIDVTKNLPGGKTIESGLSGLDWGPNQAKIGPNHMGVDLTTGGMKAPNDVIADVLNGGKLDGSKAPQNDAGGDVLRSVDGGGVKVGFMDSTKQSGPPPGAQLGSRAPNWDQVSADPKPKPLPEYVPPKPAPDTTPSTNLGKSIFDNTVGRIVGKWDENFGKDGKKYTDPDAGESPVTVSSRELPPLDGGNIDFVEGYGGRPKIEGDAPPIRYRDLVTDPGDTDETVEAKGTSEGGGVIIGGGYTDGPRKDTPVGSPPGGGTGPSNGDDL